MHNWTGKVPHSPNSVGFFSSELQSTCGLSIETRCNLFHLNCVLRRRRTSRGKVEVLIDVGVVLTKELTDLR